MKKVQLFALVALLAAGVMSSCRPINNPNDPNTPNDSTSTNTPAPNEPVYNYDESSLPGVIERDLKELFTGLMYMHKKKVEALLVGKGFVKKVHGVDNGPSVSRIPGRSMSPKYPLAADSDLYGVVYYERKVAEGFRHEYVVEFTDDSIVCAIAAVYDHPYENFSEKSFREGSRLLADFGKTHVSIYQFNAEIYGSGLNNKYYEGPSAETVHGAEDFANDLMTLPFTIVDYNAIYTDKNATAEPMIDPAMMVYIDGWVSEYDGIKLQITYGDLAKSKEVTND